MRNDDIDEIDLSRHRPSRLPGMLVIGAAIGVALIAAWFFTPILMSKDSAATASLLPAPKARAAAQDQAPVLASAQATPVAPAAAAAAAAADDPASPPAPAAAAPRPPPRRRGVRRRRGRRAGACRSPRRSRAAPPAEADTTRLAAVAPQDTPAEAVENVPLPRKRPSRLIAASLVIPLPRPRPEIEVEAPAAPTAFDLQVERMR